MCMSAPKPPPAPVVPAYVSQAIGETVDQASLDANARRRRIAATLYGRPSTILAQGKTTAAPPTSGAAVAMGS